MHHDVRIPTNGRRKVRVQRNVQAIMMIFGNVEHARAKVLGALHGLRNKHLQGQLGLGRVVLKFGKGLLDGART
jgi:hypothetical protein